MQRSRGDPVRFTRQQQHQHPGRFEWRDCPTVAAVTPGGGTGGGGTDISQAEIDRWLAAGQFRVGGVSPTRSISYSITDSFTGGPPTTQVTKSDDFTATFNRVSGADLSKLFNSNDFNVPTAGACTVTTQITNPFPNLTYTSLTRSALSVTGPAGSKTAPKKVESGIITYQAKVGTAEPGNYMDPGQYTFTGPGGPDVGSFWERSRLLPNWSGPTALT